MIIEWIFSLAVSFISGLLDLVSGSVSIPVGLMSALGNITGFGTYIIGADLILVFVGCVMFWTGLKLSIGLLLWLWKLMPLT